MGLLRFVPLLMSPGLLHTAPQRKRKKEINGEKKEKKKRPVLFFTTPHKGFLVDFWTVPID